MDSLAKVFAPTWARNGVFGNLRKANRASYLILIPYDDEQYVFGLLDAGAAGYLLKDEATAAIVAAVRGVARGEGGWFSRQVMAKVAVWARGERVVPPGMAGLTGREVEVLRGLARGWTNAHIAEESCITEQTVKNYVSAIYSKLGVKSRVEAALSVERVVAHTMHGVPQSGGFHEI